MSSIRIVIPIVLALLLVFNIQTASAQISDNVVRIGVLNDQSSIYADFGGPGSVVAARMAVEDAVCLAELVHSGAGDFEAAFRRYEAARLVRTARVQLESRALWDFYHLDQGVARDVRNATVAHWDEAHFFNCLSWLYDGAPVPDAKSH